ncbi:hypothetical protein ACO0M4_06570 [Streptomyces sp. RGM 3693]|uniref:hypothetical protein n=1 Tax=Streptomyces sp. RGM 3693 TaxID=3413284 RepID=UPI003D293509
MTVPEFRPSHVVPPGGTATWAAPDATRPLVPLDPLLPVRVVERRGDWALALCSNGWSAWVDGRLLLAVPHGPPAAGQPAARTADPRPLLAAAEGALGRYRQLVEELLAGQLDREAFAERSRGARVGAVVDGDAVWLYDARHERWCFCDGASLVTFAVSDGPAADASEGGVAEGPVADGPAAEPDAGAVEAAGGGVAGGAGSGGAGSGGAGSGGAGSGGGLPAAAEFPPPFPPSVGGQGDRP